MEIFKGAQNTYQIGYHKVWGVKYHKYIFNDTVKEFLVGVIKRICESYNFHFYCVGIDPNHVHFFAGAPPKIAPAKIVLVVKSISARELFKRFPMIKRQLWGGEFWKNGYYVGTVGEKQTEYIIRQYLQKQGLEKKADFKQLKLFY